MEKYLEELNEQQRAAVTYCDGPQLVVAGAGWGKTRVLTSKIMYLIEHEGIEPYRIMALTFTNKAAREMQERIARLIGEDRANQLWMGTFHSIFSRIIRFNAERLGYQHDYTIYDSADSRALIKLIVKDMELDDKVYKPAMVQSIISRAKNALILPDDYAANRQMIEQDEKNGHPAISAIYSAYFQRCRVAGAMDFDDLRHADMPLL
ncbi:MAG: UvrD-helicase domain-containing protein [Muribaculaceae bacterium]|nr:UvrD-helicase domain-containing protein [Muribaculaceae bacterium]